MSPVKTSIYPDEYLYARLLELSRQERRSLNQQILLMLEEYLTHVEAMAAANGNLPFTGGQPATYRGTNDDDS